MEVRYKGDVTWVGVSEFPDDDDLRETFGRMKEQMGNTRCVHIEHVGDSTLGIPSKTQLQTICNLVTQVFIPVVVIQAQKIDFITKTMFLIFMKLYNMSCTNCSRVYLVEGYDDALLHVQESEFIRR